MLGTLFPMYPATWAPKLNPTIWILSGVKPSCSIKCSMNLQTKCKLGSSEIASFYYLSNKSRSYFDATAATTLQLEALRRYPFWMVCAFHAINTIFTSCWKRNFKPLELERRCCVRYFFFQLTESMYAFPKSFIRFHFFRLFSYIPWMWKTVIGRELRKSSSCRLLWVGLYVSVRITFQSLIGLFLVFLHRENL